MERGAYPGQSIYAQDGVHADLGVKESQFKSRQPDRSAAEIQGSPRPKRPPR